MAYMCFMFVLGLVASLVYTVMKGISEGDMAGNLLKWCGLMVLEVVLLAVCMMLMPSEGLMIIVGFIGAALYAKFVWDLF